MLVLAGAAADGVQEWARMDGDRMAFGRRGELVEGPPHPYEDAYATLAIFCRTDSLPAMAAVVLEEGPFVRNIEAEARVAAQATDSEVAGPYGRTHAIRWISRPPSPTVAVLADPDLPDMWAELRAGHHLIAFVPTSGGTHHYRFDLDGFASQEERCQNAHPGRPPPENPLGGPPRPGAVARSRYGSRATAPGMSRFRVLPAGRAWWRALRWRLRSERNDPRKWRAGRYNGSPISPGCGDPLDRLRRAGLI